MSERVGQCAGCGARFRIPPSFAGTRVKCKKCGGVVEIPLPTPDSEPAFSEPSTAPRPFAKPEASPAADPSTMQRDLAAASPGSASPSAVPPADSNENMIELPPGLEASIVSALSASIENDLDEPEPEPPDEEDAAEESASLESPRFEDERPRAAPPRESEPVRLVFGAPIHPDRPLNAYRPEPHKIATPIHAPPIGAKRRRPAPKPVDPEPDPSLAKRKGHPVVAVALVMSVLIIGSIVGFIVMTRGDGHGRASSPFGTVAPDSASAPADGAAASGAANDSSHPDATPSGERPPTKFVFDSIERAPGTSDEEWRRMEAIAAQLSTRSEREHVMEALLPFGLKAVPILVNALNGLDLADETAWRDGYEVATFIQNELTAETILIPYRREFSTDAREIARNQYVLRSIVAYWNTQAKDPVRWTMLLTRYEDKQADRQRRAAK